MWLKKKKLIGHHWTGEFVTLFRIAGLDNKFTVRFSKTLYEKKMSQIVFGDYTMISK